MRITFGCMCPPLAEQAKAQGITIDDVDMIQRLADAVSRLHVHRMLTDSEVERCRNRIVKKMKIREAKS